MGVHIMITLLLLLKAFNNGRTREECPGFESDNRVGVPVEDESVFGGFWMGPLLAYDNNMVMHCFYEHMQWCSYDVHIDPYLFVSPYRFTPSQLMLRLQESELTLGMIVDLTFTDRYYSREVAWLQCYCSSEHLLCLCCVIALCVFVCFLQEFELLGVEYVKLKCPGHEIPSVEVYSKYDQSFLSKD